MEYYGLNVELLMGITDIDDKIISRANKLGKNFSEIAEEYEEDFMQSLAHLNVSISELPSLSIK